MAHTNFGDLQVDLVGELPAVGAAAPAFDLTGADLGSVSLDGIDGRTILNIFPSVDTPTCATSVRTFNERASSLDDTTVVCVSADLPFAASRFCGAEGLDRVVTGSTFRSDFGDAYGVKMAAGPFEGLLARAVVVLDADGTVLHTELVEQIGDEPDYDAAISALG